MLFFICLFFSFFLFFLVWKIDVVVNKAIVYAKKHNYNLLYMYFQCVKKSIETRYRKYSDLLLKISVFFYCFNHRFFFFEKFSSIFCLFIAIFIIFDFFFQNYFWFVILHAFLFLFFYRITIIHLIFYNLFVSFRYNAEILGLQYTYKCD